jgi:hypothetical protein
MHAFRSERLKMFETRVLRNVFGSERDEETGGCRHLHSNELHDLHSSLQQVIESRRMRWAVHVVRQWRGEVCTRFWWGNLREGDYLEELVSDGRIILEWIFNESVGRT